MLKILNPRIPQILWDFFFGGGGKDWWTFSENQVGSLGRLGNSFEYLGDSCHSLVIDYHFVSLGHVIFIWSLRTEIEVGIRW